MLHPSGDVMFVTKKQGSVECLLERFMNNQPKWMCNKLALEDKASTL